MDFDFENVLATFRKSDMELLFGFDRGGCVELCGERSERVRYVEDIGGWGFCGDMLDSAAGSAF